MGGSRFGDKPFCIATRHESSALVGREYVRAVPLGGLEGRVVAPWEGFGG